MSDRFYTEDEIQQLAKAQCEYINYIPDVITVTVWYNSIVNEHIVVLWIDGLRGEYKIRESFWNKFRSFHQHSIRLFMRDLANEVKREKLILGLAGVE